MFNLNTKTIRLKIDCFFWSQVSVDTREIVPEDGE